MLKKYVLAVLLVAVVIGLVGYSLLGGWRKVELTKVTLEEPYSLVGVAFEGDYDDPQLERNFKMLKGYLDAGILQGGLTIMYYRHPEDYEGEVEQMMGVLYPSSKVPDPLPEELVAKRFPHEEVIRAKLTNHVTVMPSPKNVRERIREYASTKQVQVDTISFETLYSDWWLEVDMPVLD